MYNVGSIFRTSDGADVSKIFLCGYTACPPRKEISKTAIGAEEAVDWEHFDDAKDCIHMLKDQGVKIVALEVTKKSIDYRKFRSKKPVCLVLGHEIDGISDEILHMCDKVISIPMNGTKESLNVAVAFGIAVYRMQRIRKKDKK